MRLKIGSFGAILKQVETNVEESRKNWMLWIFKQVGANNTKNNHYQFWQQDNQSVQLEATDFTLSKLEYIHQNPSKTGIVEKAGDYLLSNAKDYNDGKGLLPGGHLTVAYKIRK